MTATVLITRPEESALRFADQLRARWGCDVPIVLSPLMEIDYLETAPSLDGIRGLIFTSRHGVRALCRLTSERGIPCYTVGSATAEAAQDEGFAVTDAGGDATDLIALIAATAPAGPLLHIRGEHAAVDIAAALSGQGMQTRDMILYRQRALGLSPGARTCLDGGQPVILPLFSPRSARILFADMRPAAPLFVAAISRNVADMVPQGAAHAMIVARSPDASAMLQVLDDLRKSAKSLEGRNRAQ